MAIGRPEGRLWPARHLQFVTRDERMREGNPLDDRDNRVCVEFLAIPEAGSSEARSG